MRQQQAPLDPNVAQAKQKITDLTEGQADNLANDPYQKTTMDYLQGVVSGQNMPFSDSVKNSILAQQGEGASAAEAAQMSTLRDALGASGGSIYDPGYQAAQRQAMSERQGKNLDAMGQVNAQAAQANQAAQSQAANQLAAARAQQNAQINQMKLAGAGYQARTTAAVPSQGTGGGAGGQMTPAQISAQIAAQNNAVFRRS
jgi:hypothetical protein